MRKLVLASGGIHFDSDSDIIIDHVFSLAAKRDKMVFLPTACHDSRDGEETVRNYALNHGFKECTSLYLSDESLTEDYIAQTILSADVIYADGGNLKFLLETWRKTKADKYLKEAYANGTVLGGQSSGAMCWCKRGYDDCGIDGRYMFLDGLDLIPYILCPHFEYWPSFLEDVKMQELDGIGVDDDIAVSIVDGEYTIINNMEDENHSAYYLPAEEGYTPIDLQKTHAEIKNL